MHESVPLQANKHPSSVRVLSTERSQDGFLEFLIFSGQTSTSRNLLFTEPTAPTPSFINLIRRSSSANNHT